LPSRIRGIIGGEHHKFLPLGLIRNCQFPDPVILPGGRRLSKPSSW
jgi:hypothetical protein